MKTAIVTGILGQDGSYLAEHLLEEGYKVKGLYRRISSGTNYMNIQTFREHENLEMVDGDILDYGFMNDLIGSTKPDLFFNLAAMSHVGHSFKIPAETFRVNAEAVISQLDIIRRTSPETRFYQASTSEMFGGLACPEAGYTEESALRPRSPYAVAKLAAHEAVRNFRDSYGLYACAGILFNHSSPRRGVDFATRKITNGVARIVLGKQDNIHMGNMEAVRDEGHAYDYVRAMHLMLQQESPDDFVISTGDTATIGEMLTHVCDEAGLSYDDVYLMNEKFMRPSDVPYLRGDATKAREALGWEPKYDWKRLLSEMYQNDLSLDGEV